MRSRHQIERDQGGNEGWKVDDGELQRGVAAQCVEGLVCERGSAVAFRFADEDVRAGRKDEEQGLRVIEGSTRSERALRIPDRSGRVAAGRAHLGTDRVDLEGAVVRRSGLDLGDELIGGPQRVVPLAAPVAVVDQHAFEPAQISRGSHLHGDSFSREP